MPSCPTQLSEIDYLKQQNFDCGQMGKTTYKNHTIIVIFKNQKNHPLFTAINIHSETKNYLDSIEVTSYLTP